MVEKNLDSNILLQIQYSKFTNNIGDYSQILQIFLICFLTWRNLYQIFQSEWESQTINYTFAGTSNILSRHVSL